MIIAARKCPFLKKAIAIAMLASLSMTTFPTHGDAQVSLRGKAISSMQKPLDSVIVRLFKSDLAVHTKPDGSFVLGDAVSPVMMAVSADTTDDMCAADRMF
jgi:hypothetical protein